MTLRAPNYFNVAVAAGLNSLNSLDGLAGADTTLSIASLSLPQPLITFAAVYYTLEARALTF